MKISAQVALLAALFVSLAACGDDPKAKADATAKAEPKTTASAKPAATAAAPAATAKATASAKDDSGW